MTRSPRSPKSPSGQPRMSPYYSPGGAKRLPGPSAATLLYSYGPPVLRGGKASESDVDALTFRMLHNMDTGIGAAGDCKLLLLLSFFFFLSLSISLRNTILNEELSIK